VIWVTWRRLRGVLVAGAAVVLAAMAWALYVGQRAQRLLGEYQKAPCLGGVFPGANAPACVRISSQYYNLRDTQGNFVQAVCVVVVVIAAVVGALAIAGEFDRGTVRWAWTQSLTRRRWWGDATLVALSATAVLVTPLAITMSWFEGAVQYSGRFNILAFLADGWVLVPVAMVATALAMVAGLFLRRPGWLIALCAVVVLGGYYVEQRSFRTFLLSPETLVAKAVVIPDKSGGQYSVTSPNYQSDIIFSGPRAVGQSGIPSNAQSVANGNATAACQTKLAHQLYRLPLTGGYETPAQMATLFNRCDTQLGLQYVFIYFPLSKFWSLQDREGALDLALVALFWWGGWWWVRRSRS